MKFLSGKSLSSQIIQTIKEEELRCAVAFWGKKFAYQLCERKILSDSPKIVCNISMGGTSPDALKALGAPKNKELRYDDKLHAKIYISKIGAVVCSANASLNGVGDSRNDPKLAEAGFYVDATHPEYRAVSKWFDDIYSKATQVKDNDIARAKDAQKRPFSESIEPAKDKSLIEFICENPKKIEEISVIITTTSRGRDESIKIINNYFNGSTKKESIDVNWLFTGFSDKEYKKWSEDFFSIHIEHGHVAKCYFGTRAGRQPKDGNLPTEEINSEQLKEKFSIPMKIVNKNTLVSEYKSIINEIVHGREHKVFGRGSDFIKEVLYIENKNRNK